MAAINKEKIKYLFTFDYELFLGPETGTVEKCLLEPTERLLTLGRNYGVRYVFFVDTLYLLKLKEFSTTNARLAAEYTRIIGQLIKATQEGHDIELHLHPQWYYSTYDYKNGKWLLDFIHYKLSECSISDVEKMIGSSCNLIKEIKGEYPVAYRAGGYSAPKTREFWDSLRNYGIKFDSSVIVGEKSETTFQSYDYSHILSPNPYSFTTNNTIAEFNGAFLEVPISTLNISRILRAIIEKPIIKFQKGLLSVYGDGKGVGYLYKEDTNITNKQGFFDPVRLRSSVDFRNTVWAKLFIARALVKKHPFVVFIGHPKNQTEYSLKSLARLFKNRKLAEKVITFKDLA